MEELKQAENELIKLKSDANAKGDTALFGKADSMLRKLRVKLSFAKNLKLLEKKHNKTHQKSLKLSKKEQLDIANDKFFEHQRLLAKLNAFIRMNLEYFLQLDFINKFIDLQKNYQLKYRVRLNNRLIEAESKISKLRCSGENIQPATDIRKNLKLDLNPRPKLTQQQDLEISEEMKQLRLKQRLAAFSEKL